MKKYTNAKAEIYQLDAGDVMLNVSNNVLNLDQMEESKNFSLWGNWND